MRHDRKRFTPGLTVFRLTDAYQIAEDDWSDELVYPDERGLDMKHVRYIQWQGGCHWYAKVGKLDIIDADGNQKWNSKAEAEKAARWFLSKRQ